MSKRSHSLFGSSSDSFRQEIRVLEEDILSLTSLKEKQAMKLAQLTQALHERREEVELVQEAIADAKNLARTMVSDAKEQAQEIMLLVEEDLKAYAADFEEQLSNLNRLKATLVEQKQGLEEELIALMGRHKSAVETLDDEAFHQLSQEMVLGLEEVDQVLAATKGVLGSLKDAGAVSQQPKVLNVLPETDGDIPVYSFG